MKRLLLFWLLSGLAQAQELRLVIVGGGDRPPEAVQQFFDWAGGRKARILVIAWASEQPEANLESLRQDFPAQTQLELAQDPERFLAQLRDATGVWFTGGDQTKIMMVLQDPTLLEALRAKYRAGAVFGGTSAGTAIMSQRMLTGDADMSVLNGKQVGLSQGLGLLPYRLIVDQHFLKRQRENRLFGLVLENPDSLGVGIDESTALLIRDGRHARVAGQSQVMLVHPRNRHSLLIDLFKAGDEFDL